MTNTIDPGEITLLLKRVGAGHPDAGERLAELVYAELRRIASKFFLSERRDHTLQPTVVATEAYLRLVDHTSHNWQNRAHFFAAAAQAMRRILVDYGRRKRSQKRGGGSPMIDLGPAVGGKSDMEDLLSLDQALTRLEAIDKRQSQIVEMRYFSGLTEEETAEVLNVSLRTVKRDWECARAWLKAELTRPREEHGSDVLLA